MKTAYRLSSGSSRTPMLLKICSLLVLLGAAALPGFAQGDVEFRVPGQQFHPILGSITDDSGPFWNVVWGSTSNLTTQWSLPPRENHAAKESTDGSGQAIVFNSVSGVPIASWVVRETPADSGDLLVSYFTVGGWTTPERVAQGASDPLMAIDPVEGIVHVAYRVPSTGELWHRQADARLQAWSAPQRISAIAERVVEHALIVDDRNLSVAYEASYGTDDGLRSVVIAQAPRQSTSVEQADYDRLVLATKRWLGPSNLRFDADREGGRLLLRWADSPSYYGWALRTSGGTWIATGHESWPGGRSPLARERSQPVCFPR